MSDERILAQLRRMMPKIASIDNIVKHMLATCCDGGGGDNSSVDFIVDNFDRNGVKGLGEYWENPGAFSVVQNTGAIAMAGSYGTKPTALSGTTRRTYADTIYCDYVTTVLEGAAARTMQSGGQLARYKRRLSSDNFTIQVKFTVEPPVDSGEVEAGKAIYYAPNQAFGACTSFDVDELGGLCASIWADRVVEDTEYNRELAALRSFVTSSNGANIAINTNANAVYDFKYAGFVEAAGLTTTGENVMKVVINDNTASLYINDQLVFSDSTGAFTKGRMVGLMSFAACALSGGAANNTPSAITQFMAWTGGEPPGSESGHGTETDGSFTYTDGYHDSEGNYNPLALEA